MSSADNKTTYYDAGVAKEEPDIQVQATATPLDTGNVQPSHIEGSSRYFCSKCQTVSVLAKFARYEVFLIELMN